MNSDAANAIAQGGVTATALVFFSDSLTKMIPYSFVALPLILLDLDFGVKAARHRGEKIRTSTAIRKTLNKICEYVCWIVVASTAALAFDKPWIEWLILGLVFGNEFLSVVGNYFETKDIEFSLIALFRWVFKWGSGKAGHAMDDAEAADIIKPKDKPRDAKGRFVKRTK